MSKSVAYLFFLALAFARSTVAQDSCTATAEYSSPVVIPSTDIALFTQPYLFSGCELETVVPSLVTPAGNSISCTVPVDADYAGPLGFANVTCPIGTRELPSGMYHMVFYLGNGGAFHFDFSIMQETGPSMSPVPTTTKATTTLVTTAKPTASFTTITKTVRGKPTTITKRVKAHATTM